MSKFHKIGIFSKPNPETETVLNQLIPMLQNWGHELVLERVSAECLSKPPAELASLKTLGHKVDLMIVIGGDGSLLKASRALVEFEKPIIGINRGRMGFLADILPDKMEQQLKPILAGEYFSEERMLLAINLKRQGQVIANYCALNDMVLYNSSIARMLEFEVHIDQQFVLFQRADGLIAATPTGSTAYALSADGPILYPTLDAISIVPMYPHTLSSRPLVIKDESTIVLKLPQTSKTDAKISCDGQIHVALKPEDEIEIKKHQKSILLLHPKDYNYFAMLREKLGWNSNLTSDRYPQAGRR